MPSSPNAFAQLRMDVAQRRQEVLTFWSEVRSWWVAPPHAQSFRFNAGVGMTIVFVYGFMEFSLTRAVNQLAELISQEAVRAKDYAPAVRVLAQEPRIQSIISTSDKRGIKKRLELYEEVYSASHCKIDGSLLSGQVQNVWAVSVENVFSSFGIKSSPFFETGMNRRIDQVVDDRNAVAHGRQSPEEVGRRYALTDIDATILKFGQQVDYMVIQMEEYYSNTEFVSSQWRHRYQ
jgi:hypothetical protein